MHSTTFDTKFHLVSHFALNVSIPLLCFSYSVFDHVWSHKVPASSKGNKGGEQEDVIHQTDGEDEITSTMIWTICVPELSHIYNSSKSKVLGNWRRGVWASRGGPESMKIRFGNRAHWIPRQLKIIFCNRSIRTPAITNILTFALTFNQYLSTDYSILAVFIVTPNVHTNVAGCLLLTGDAA